MSLRIDDATAQALDAWLTARDQRMTAGERLAALNLATDYQRPDDAPEVLAWQAAQRAVDLAADTLDRAARGPP